VRAGKGYISVNTEEIAYILSENKLNYLVLKRGRRYPVDYTMEQLQRMLNPVNFQRINRNFIVGNQSIKRMEPYFNNRMLLQLDPPYSGDVLVNRNYLKEFRKWIDL
jgi:DNA-binding LytR/AlgR family response regulator